jgi:hypothetical protein
MTQLNALLGQIDTETMVLPEFQRGYVWSRDQVRGGVRPGRRPLTARSVHEQVEH